MGKELYIMKIEKKKMKEIISMINMKEKVLFILKMEMFKLEFLKMAKFKFFIYELEYYSLKLYYSIIKDFAIYY
jgi:hypothetical protein